jgi:hypothetical protein
MNIPSLIFFVYPDPKGSEENQFTPLGAGVNKLIFKRFSFLYIPLSIVILSSIVFSKMMTKDEEATMIALLS